MTGRRRAALVALVVATTHLTGKAASEPAPTPPEAPAVIVPPVPVNIDLLSPSRVVTDGGSELRLPPGHFLEAPLWQKLDAEQRRLQTAEVRLTAENQSMRKSLQGWQPGFYTLAVVLGGGIVLGYELQKHLQ